MFRENIIKRMGVKHKRHIDGKTNCTGHNSAKREEVNRVPGEQKLRLSGRARV